MKKEGGEILDFLMTEWDIIAILVIGYFLGTFAFWFVIVRPLEKEYNELVDANEALRMSVSTLEAWKTGYESGYQIPPKEN